jgi:hypothetical protein
MDDLLPCLLSTFLRQLSAFSSMERTSARAPSNAIDDHLDEQDECPSLARRRYRSKVQRPCDFCRRRKVHCNITDPSRPCQLCERFQRSCTFLEKPHKKSQRESLPRRQAEEQGQGEEQVQEHGQEQEREQEREHGRFVGDEQAGKSIEAAEQPMELLYSLGNPAPDRRQIGNGSEFNDGHVQRSHCNPTGEHSSTIQRDMLVTRDVPVTAADQMQLISPDCYIDALNSEYPDQERAYDWQSDVNHDGTIHHLSATDTPSFSAVEAHDVVMHERSTKRRRRGGSSSACKSLDMCYGYTSQLFGLSGEADPYLLDFYPYGRNHEFRFSKVIYRRLHNESYSSLPAMPTQFLLSHDSITAPSLARAESDAGGMENWSTHREELDQLIREEHRVPLFEMYVQRDVFTLHTDSIYSFIDHVFHAVPVVSRSRFYADPKKAISEMPTALLAAIYAIALPFSGWDDKLCVEDAYSSPPTEVIWRIAHRCFTKEISRARLSTVQAAILLLHRAVPSQLVADPPTSWVSVSSALAIAQSLGLHMDPGDWDLPAWEIRLRRRLWWTLFVEEKWRALSYGRPSHIHRDDWHVLPPTDKDFELDFETLSQSAVHHLLLTTSLTMIVDEICQCF